MILSFVVLLWLLDITPIKGFNFGSRIISNKINKFNNLPLFSSEIQDMNLFEQDAPFLNNNKLINEDPNNPNNNERYKAITLFNIDKMAEKYPRLQEKLDDIRLSSLIFPFKASPYVIDELIDWNCDGDIKDDPFYKLIFPTMDMLTERHQMMLRTTRDEHPLKLKEVVAEIREELNPHPAGQQTLNAPKEKELTGVQHKYTETVLFFPFAAQTCHAYCTYCFRWAQFIGDDDLKFAQSEADSFFEYLDEHKHVSDILFTGGDPMIMKTRVLKKYLEPFKDPNFLPHIRNLRIGTRTLSFWPQRFLTDDDADELMELMAEVNKKGNRQFAIMAHLSHKKELKTDKVRAAIKRLQTEGKAVIRSQSPIMKGINDDAQIWSEKWKEEVNLGIVPYYMFVARDTGAQSFFGVSLAKAHEVFTNAIRTCSGLAKTVRGPSMSCTPGKVEITGIEEVNGELAYVMRFLQCRNSDWIGRLFFAKYDDQAIWFDQLKPLAGQQLPWDETGLPRPVPEKRIN